MKTTLPLTLSAIIILFLAGNFFYASATIPFSNTDLLRNKTVSFEVLPGQSVIENNRSIVISSEERSDYQIKIIQRASFTPEQYIDTLTEISATSTSQLNTREVITFESQEEGAYFTHNVFEYEGFTIDIMHSRISDQSSQDQREIRKILNSIDITDTVAF